MEMKKDNFHIKTLMKMFSCFGWGLRFGALGFVSCKMEVFVGLDGVLCFGGGCGVAVRRLLYCFSVCFLWWV